MNEGFSKLSSNCFITDSPYDIRNLIANKPKLYRILYDSNIDRYMIGDGDELIHWDMLQVAYNHGYYANYEEFIDEIGGTLANYVELGIHGCYEDDFEVYPYLWYIVFSPSNEWEEEVMEYGDDGYDREYKCEFGKLFTRQCRLEDIDLYRILKIDRHTNENAKFRKLRFKLVD